MSAAEVRVDAEPSSFVRGDEEQPLRLLPSAPAFPVDALPEPSASLVTEGAAAIGVPPDLIAAAFLGFAAGAIGRHRKLRVKPGWDEFPVLYLAVVAPPGSAKTPALRLAMHPLEVLQQEAFDRYQAEVRAYESALASREAIDEAGRDAMPARPVLDHLYSTDATMEAIAVLARDSAGLTLFHDELTGWIGSMNAYRSAGDRQRWLSLWSSAALKVDRKGAPDPLYVPNPAISVVGGVQPDLLSALHNEAGRRDGFIERILWSRPEVTSARWSEAMVDDATKSAVADTFRRLRSLPDVRCAIVAFSGAAREQYVSWFNGNQGRIATASGIEQGMLAKLPSQAARLALVLHCLADPDGHHDQLSGATLADALDLAEYFVAHARLVLPAFAGANARSLASRVLETLINVSGWVSRRRLHRSLGGHVLADQLDAALEELAGHGLVEQREDRATGGRPSQEWRALPM